MRTHRCIVVLRGMEVLQNVLPSTNEIFISCTYCDMLAFLLPCSVQYSDHKLKEAVARRILSLVDMITEAKFSNCPYVFKIGLFSVVKYA